MTPQHSEGHEADMREKATKLAITLRPEPVNHNRHLFEVAQIIAALQEVARVARLKAIEECRIYLRDDGLPAISILMYEALAAPDKGGR